MGPGIAIKAILQGSFSLMVFGWAQIVMDLQPLLSITTGLVELHGFSHTFVGAALLTVVSALSGKHLSELGLHWLGLNRQRDINIAWWVVFVSAALGTSSHVVIDSIMHSDIMPFAPFSEVNPWLGWVTIDTLHRLCYYSALLGAVLYYLVQWLGKRRLK